MNCTFTAWMTQLVEKRPDDVTANWARKGIGKIEEKSLRKKTETKTVKTKFQSGNILKKFVKTMKVKKLDLKRRAGQILQMSLTTHKSEAQHVRYAPLLSQKKKIRA